jgi:putative sporulation protein YtaF
LSYFAVLLLAIAVSVDGLGAGLACGLKGVRIPLSSIALMGAAAGGAVLTSMVAGALVSKVISPRLAVLSGGMLLILLGLFLLWQAGKGAEQGGLMGLVHDPALADTDHSGSISAREAVMLGIALALDGFGAGFGVALAGFSPAATGLAVAVVKVAFVSAGLRLGQMARSMPLKKIKALPGLIIMVLGLLKIILL